MPADTNQEVVSDLDIILAMQNDNSREDLYLEIAFSLALVFYDISNKETREDMARFATDCEALLNGVIPKIRGSTYYIVRKQGGDFGFKSINPPKYADFDHKRICDWIRQIDSTLYGI